MNTRLDQFSASRHSRRNRPPVNPYWLAHQLDHGTAHHGWATTTRVEINGSITTVWDGFILEVYPVPVLGTMTLNWVGSGPTPQIILTFINQTVVVGCTTTRAATAPDTFTSSQPKPGESIRPGTQNAEDSAISNQSCAFEQGFQFWVATHEVPK